MTLYIRNAFFAGVIGGTFAWIAITGWLSDRASDPTPSPVTCDQLATNGPPGNLYVDLSDCKLSTDFIQSSRHNEIWIEASAPRGQRGRRIIIKSRFTKRLELKNMPHFRGIIRRASSFHIEGDAMEKLRAEDPWILDLGERPQSLESRIGLLIVGLILLGVAGYNLKLNFDD
jgi:hypothetical protein